MLRRVRCRLICASAGEHAEIPVDVEDFGGIVKKIKRSITHAHLHGPCGHVHVAVGNTTTMQVMSAWLFPFLLTLLQLVLLTRSASLFLLSERHSTKGTFREVSTGSP